MVYLIGMSWQPSQRSSMYMHRATNVDTVCYKMPMEKGIEISSCIDVLSPGYTMAMKPIELVFPWLGL